MKLMSYVLLMSGLLLSSGAFACSYEMAAFVFVRSIDTNNDGKVNRKEWRQADASQAARSFKLDFKVGDTKAFRRFDTNKDRQLSPEELNNYVGYHVDPCAGYFDNYR